MRILPAILIVTVATTIAADDASSPSQHWAFQPLRRPAVPDIRNSRHEIRNPIDRFIRVRLEANGLQPSLEADKLTLIRRVAFDLTGLPPTPADVFEFVNDAAPDAFERMAERYLASPQYGERWGKWWLDVAGYADSNGYFQADSDRPLAYRYRDYVIRSFNANTPFDQFVREQIAGDELSGFDPKLHERNATPELIEMLEATHFLRNGPDGSGESDGNPDEVKSDRYYALEGSQQIIVSSLLGLTIQCAKCHDHKFEPISQREYFQFQAHLFPVFNLQKWLKPNERFTHASLLGEIDAWESRQRELERLMAGQRTEFTRWVRDHRPRAAVIFQDDFNGPESSFSENWSNTAPGDDAPGGTATVTIAVNQAAAANAPAALRMDGVLKIIEGGPSGDKWISTTRAFDWTPNQPGEWIQATFDVLDNKSRADEKLAERIAFFIAAHDFNDNSQTPGGNILIDGNPAGGAAVYLDYPGDDQKQRGSIGSSGYVPGRNFGVRVTNIDGKKFKLEQIVDWLPENKTLDLTAADLPDGGFAFEFCCGRSFVVDNVVVESSAGNATDEAAQAAVKKFREVYDSRRKALAETTQQLQKQQAERPGKIAWAADVSADAPDVPVLVRGNVTTPGELVQPATFAVLSDSTRPSLRDHKVADRSTGRRTSLANWLTQPDSRAAALMARVQVNRIWQQHFGRGLVATPDNLGVSSAPPSHPELLEWLAAELVGIADCGLRIANSSAPNPQSAIRNPQSQNWDIKHIHRLIVTSAIYRQSSAESMLPSETPHSDDPDNRLLARFPLRRLDAESIRDSMLAVGGELDRRIGGPFVPTQRSSAAEVVVSANHPGANRRSVYLQQRRTQTVSLLQLFDAPSVVFNCVQRPTTTMPLQSLSLLNSDFALSRAREFAARLDRDAPPDPRRRARLAFELVQGRAPHDDELREALQFIEDQTRLYEPADDAPRRAWNDLCQMLLASNGFLYVE